MLYVPAASAMVEHVAAPLAMAAAAQPPIVAPFALKLTVPVGVVLPITRAVKVTDCPAVMV